jgi:hypothetical protein
MASLNVASMVCIAHFFYLDGERGEVECLVFFMDGMMGVVIMSDK